jgi:hypothetical protein
MVVAKATAKGYSPLYDNYLRHMKALHGQARDFLAEVKRRASSRTHEAEVLIDRINSDWRSVRPETGARRISPSSAFHARAEVFDPAGWPEVDARALHSAIKLCGDKFNIARSYYNRLPPAEKRLVRGMRP